MAHKRVSGIGAVDRSIKAKRAALAKIKKAKSEAKRLAKKKATLKKLENQLKNARRGHTATRRRK